MVFVRRVSYCVCEGELDVRDYLGEIPIVFVRENLYCICEEERHVRYNRKEDLWRL